MKELAFIGDIHGCLEELENIVTQARRRTPRLVFLGDYVNRGRKSREVIDYLIRLRQSSEVSCIFILGNHDQAFLDTLVCGKIDRFLRMGGAATIASYVDAPRGDLLSQVRQAVPRDHVDFLQALIPSMLDGGVFAAHDRAAQHNLEIDPSVFRIYGHSPQRDLVPTINATEAFIDTGCGTIVGGRLTCVFWPSLDWVQSTPCVA